MTRKTILIFAIMLTVLSISASMVLIDTLGSEGDTLQYYINTLAATPLFNPDTIVLMPGMYHVSINGDTGLVMRDSIVLMGMAPSACTLTAVSENGADTANHVVSFWNIGPNCYSGLKYLTLAGCITDENGAGICIVNSSPFIDSCLITENRTSGYGGGIFIWNNSSPDIIGNVIMSNTANGGGGIFIDSLSHPYLIDNVITLDSAQLIGGGIAINNSGANILTTSILANASAGNGGGICAINNSNTMIDDCEINYNTAASGQGGGIILYNSYCDLTNSVIKYNMSDSIGGGLYILNDIYGMTGVYNNVIDSNISDYGAGIAVSDSSISTINENQICGNSASVGGGIGIGFYADPIITNNTILGNYASEAGGGMALYDNCSPQITGNEISGNSTSHYGGGIFMDDHCDPIIDSNIISSNSSSQYGGGIHAQFYCDPLIQNNLISANSTILYGGGLFIYDYSAPNINYNEISDNSSRNGGGGIFVYSNASVYLTGDLLYGNRALSGGGGLAVVNDASASLMKCVIAGNVGGKGGAFLDTINAMIIVDSSFITDNGSKSNSISGLAHISISAAADWGLNLSRSNVYYNTFQADTEIANYMTDTLTCTNNYWHMQDSTEIADIIYGEINFMPFETSFIAAAAGEPQVIDSVRAYIDTLYTVQADSLNDHATIYLSVAGDDHTPDIQESSVCIVKSNLYPNGIAVALKETGKNTGIYRGSIWVAEAPGGPDIRDDDIDNTIRVDSLGDTIKIIANTDTLALWTVLYKYQDPSGLTVKTSEPKESMLNIPAILTHKSEMAFTMQNTGYAKIEVIDMLGRIVAKPIDGVFEAGKHTFEIDTPNGVYFVRFTCSGITENRRITIIK